MQILKSVEIVAGASLPGLLGMLVTCRSRETRVLGGASLRFRYQQLRCRAT